ncbi:MAG: DUF4974 domain-containing protein [Bacteroidales bacterium]|nr:DUF4974 domain-containing protein [Bacteroidales bacterium]
MIDTNLLVKYLKGETSKSENSEILRWVEQSAENEKTFLDCKLIWQRIGDSLIDVRNEIEIIWSNIEKKIDHVSHDEQNESYNGKEPKKGFDFLKIAATFIISFAAAWFIMKNWPGDDKIFISHYQFKTPFGAKSEIILPDSTHVWLNSGSKIIFPQKFSKANRQIYFEGEAFFNVKKMGKSPFVVSTGDIEIQVLGTRFNVKAYPEEVNIETILEQGKLKLMKSGKKIVLLEPNDIATYNKDQKLIEIKHVSDTRRYTAWTDGKLIFDNEKLEDIIIKLERWYNVRINIENNSLKQIRFTGTFERESVEQALNIIRLTTPLNYSMDKNKIVIF